MSPAQSSCFRRETRPGEIPGSQRRRVFRLSGVPMPEIRGRSSNASARIAASSALSRRFIGYTLTAPRLLREPRLGLERQVQAGDSQRRRVMAIHKVIEVLSQSDASWEDAARQAVADAGKTVKNIKSIYVKNMEGIVRDGKIVQYRINANITFEVGQ
jgi:flavin-binding protein dodecin